MSDFKGTEEAISTIKETLDTIQIKLEDTYTRILAVQQTLEDNKIWAGESQLVGIAFLDLVVQYHGQLAPEKDGPVSMASEALQAYLDDAESFYTGWSKHMDLMGI